MDRDIIEHDFTMTVLANDIVTVTDPCYDKDNTWCTVSTALPPGEYCFAVELVDYGAWGELVCRNFMFRKGKVKAWQLDTSVYLRREYLGEACVDAGLCGYFIDKPDFTDPQWMEFCEALRDRRPFHGALPEFANGFFSDTGHGDGCYDVYLLTDRETGEPVGLSTVFIREDEDEEEDEDYEDEEDEEED